ncbi:MAG: DinB family protein [Bryobacter sp.]|nr:DinB family protein [Bryobacter sp.]
MFRSAVEDAICRVEALAPSADEGSGWTRSEILGHLIDSALNNHQRFVRAALDGGFCGPGYSQDAWVALQDYRATPWPELVSLWASLNRHLVRVVERIPADRLPVRCVVGEGEPVTLGFLIEDYVRHLRHHLHQLDA